MSESNVTEGQDKMIRQMVITRGIPASGKSTFARHWVAKAPDNRIEANRDNIRTMLGFPPLGNREQEQMVTNIHRSVIATAISNHRDVIVSDTNLRLKFVRDLVKIGLDAGYEVTIKDFPIDIHVAIERDRHRRDSVGEDVIRTITRKFPQARWVPGEEIIASVRERAQEDRFTPYVNDTSNPPAILVDVDGTIAHNHGVRDFFDYSDAVMRDTPDYAVIRAVNIAREAGVKVVVMSGRKEVCKADTIRWMHQHSVAFDEIHMRADDDNRADWIVKDELVREHIQDNYHILWCYDDRNQVVNHHRAMGYQVFQVAPGDF